jgi:multiple sugar transport system permease protein
MLKSRRNEILTAMVLVAPFVGIYGWLFVYPTIQMVRLSLTDSPLIGWGNWVGIDNYVKLIGDRLFGTAVWNTSYFVLLTVIPGTLAALGIALMVSRLRGRLQSMVLAAFFLPFILPVTVV